MMFRQATVRSSTFVTPSASAIPSAGQLTEASSSKNTPRA